MGLYLTRWGGPPASQRTISHLPMTEEKSFSPTSSATAAPQPSWMPGWFLRISLSKSSNVFVRVALTKVWFSYPAGRAERFLSSFGMTCFAHHSAVRGPGVSAQDCPSKTAKNIKGALFSKRPPCGRAIFDLAATFLRSLTMMCLTRGFSPMPSARPRLTASTDTLRVSEFSSSRACSFCSSASSTILLMFWTAPCCFNFHSGVPEYPALDETMLAPLGFADIARNAARNCYKRTLFQLTQLLVF
mmetsp:Transcript_21121/g.45795  ORF Transcript_21121/g.45795 Transcript_21121/m.45795 type:complete len:245 (-) Transcript_21121:18-752(-)